MISNCAFVAIVTAVLCSYQTVFANLQPFETNNQVSQHAYVDGEVFEYLFEDTEATFDTVRVKGFEQPK